MGVLSTGGLVMGLSSAQAVSDVAAMTKPNILEKYFMII
jgi:hypothetical protein